ncbi:TetR family transcriptional regulator [Marivirga lumbricoides]|uniref:TetR family transcriptional regulator n=1 Tax=Marivirga lumbricoides TaxID=1046115 RepID=A0ABQ1M462_9BACT|nr:TetR family transcriptional regulator [Marivirga lumbricoides]
MSKREEIIQLADTMLRKKGYNAFSYHDIAREVGIKTASIHYHFPAKSDLGVAIINQHIEGLKRLIHEHEGKSPVKQLNAFFSIYDNLHKENKVCLVGSLATDFNTLDARVQEKLKEFSDLMLHWVSGFLETGRNEGLFEFEEEPRSKALMVISHMLAIVQLVRLTHKQDFAMVKAAIKKELLKK